MLLPTRLIPTSAAPALLLERGLWAAVVIAAAVAMSPNVADPDLWGHVQYGRDLIQHGLPTFTTYSYVATNQPWINHENLSELILAILADTIGPIGLLVAKFALAVTILRVIGRRCRQLKCGMLACTAVLLLTAYGLGHYWSLRPQLFSFTAYAGMLALLDWCFEGWEGKWQLTWPRKFAAGSNEIHYQGSRMRWLWLMPPLMAAWTNAHGGFVAGWCVFTAYCAIRSVELCSQRGYQALGLMRRFMLMSFASLAATFVNPYGFRFHAWLFEDLRVPRPEITEWLPPNLFETQSLPLVLLVATFVMCLAFSRLSWDLTHLVILVLTLGQSLAHQRHIPFFALSMAFFIPGHVQSVFSRFGLGSQFEVATLHSKRMRMALAAGSVMVFMALGFKLFDRLADLKVERDSYPLSAVEFIAQHRMQGRIVCSFNWAQYLLFAQGARTEADEGLRVHVDGRCRTAFSQAQLDEHFDFLFGQQTASERYRDPTGTFEPMRALEHRRPNLVLIDRGQPHSVETMQRQSARWTLLYQDSLAQLWGRRERYDDPQSPEYIAPTERKLSDDPQQGYVTWPAVPQVSSHDNTDAAT